MLVDNQGDNDLVNGPTSPQSLHSSQTWSSPGNGYQHRSPAQIFSNWETSQNEPASEQLRMPPSRPSGTKPSNGVKQFSLALNPTKSAVWVGDSGEADPWLCRRYQYDRNEECILSRITYQRVKPVSDAPRRRTISNDFVEPPLIFMLPDDALAYKGEPRSDHSDIEAAQKEIKELVPDDVGVRMVKLFFRFVYRKWSSLYSTHCFTLTVKPTSPSCLESTCSVEMSKRHLFLCHYHW
jgi:hypothetical protein